MQELHSTNPRYDSYFDSVKAAPWVPTPVHLVDTMLEMAQVGSQDVVCDLGSGDGRILFAAVERFGVKKAIGYELRDDLFEASLRDSIQRSLQDRVTILRKNLYEANLYGVSVVMLYLSPEANKVLRLKLERELQYGTRVVSLTFRIIGWQAKSINDCSYGHNIGSPPLLPLGYPYYPIYLYVMNESLQSC